MVCYYHWFFINDNDTCALIFFVIRNDRYYIDSVLQKSVHGTQEDLLLDFIRNGYVGYMLLLPASLL